jgi:hypothetical protein
VPKKRKLRDLNLPEKTGVTEADIRLSADTDGKEERSAASGENYEVACFIALRQFGKATTSLVYVLRYLQ